MPRAIHPTHQLRMFVATILIALALTGSTLLIKAPDIIRAQNGGATCNQILPEVQKRLISCSALNRDQVCYGNPAIMATFADSAGPITFSKSGDIVDLTLLKSIQTTPLNLQRNEWGIAALKVQVTNLDGTTTGQAATFALFGDTSLTNATPPEQQTAVKTTPLPACDSSMTRVSNLRSAPNLNGHSAKILPAGTKVNITGRLADGSWLFAEGLGETGWVPALSVKLSCDAASRPIIDPSVPTVLAGLRAFYFTTGVAAQAQCRDVPEGGFLVRSPNGRKVEFKVDGADISMGSTIQVMQANGQLIFSVIDGEITVTVDGRTVTIKKGQQLSVNLNNSDPPQAVGPLGDPVPAQNLPSNAVLCAVQPVLGYQCNVGLPPNVTVNDPDPILRPDGSNDVIGPFPPPPGSPPQEIPPTIDPCSLPPYPCS